MKKILFFHHYNSAIGAGICLIHIVRAIKEDFEITVALPKGGNLPMKIRDIGVNVIECDNSPCAYMHYNGSTTRFFSLRHLKNIVNIQNDRCNVKRIIEEVNPDIIAVNSMTLFWIGDVGHKLGKKTICFHRETYKKGIFGLRSSYIKKRLKRDFDGVAFISYYDMEQTGNSKYKFVRITDKVDLNIYNSRQKEKIRQELGLPKNDILILYTGGCNKLKGGLVAVKSLKFVKHQHIKLLFLQYSKMDFSKGIKVIKLIIKRIFRKDYQFIVEKEIAKSGLDDRIIFHPSTDEVEKYFIACDAVVFPSTLAHQARPIYEAGAAEIPIFISDFANTKEFVTEENGYCFQVNNAEELAERIDEWLDNQEDAKKKILANKEKTYQEHNLASLNKELLGFIHTL